MYTMFLNGLDSSVCVSLSLHIYIDERERLL